MSKQEGSEVGGGDVGKGVWVCDARVRYFAIFLLRPVILSRSLEGEGIVKGSTLFPTLSLLLLLLLLLRPVLSLTLLSAPSASSTSSALTGTLSTTGPSLSLLTLPPRSLSTGLATGTDRASLPCSSGAGEGSLASILLFLPALDNDLLVTTAFGRDPDPTLTAVLGLQRGDDGLSCRLDRLVLDKRARLGLDKVDLDDLAVLAERVAEDGLGDGRGCVLRLPVVQLRTSTTAIEHISLRDHDLVVCILAKTRLLSP